MVCLVPMNKGVECSQQASGPRTFVLSSAQPTSAKQNLANEG